MTSSAPAKAVAKAAIAKALAFSLLPGHRRPCCRQVPLHPADKVNLNTADAATIDRVLFNIGASKAAGDRRLPQGTRRLQEPRAAGAGQGHRPEDGRKEPRPHRARRQCGSGARSGAARR